jgi:hypothetical protein
VIFLISFTMCFSSVLANTIGRPQSKGVFAQFGGLAMLTLFTLDA